MVTETREVRLAVEKAVSRQDILQLIPQFELKSILRRHHLKRTIIGGLIGNRGDGKSGISAAIGLVDFMLEGMPCFANMDIRCDLKIDDETARKYGLNYGGIAHYASKPINWEALLSFDPEYHGVLVVGDEINMEGFDARRSMSNTNLWGSNVAQEIRHLESHLLYTVIDEMFIDSRLRSMSDFFLKCEDTALSVDGLDRKQEEGMNMKIIPYPMSGYLCGRENTYYVTHKPMLPVFFDFGLIRGIYDDKQLQAAGKPKYATRFKKKDGSGDMAGVISVDDSHQQEQFDKWGWLGEEVRVLRNSGLPEIISDDLFIKLKTEERGLSREAVGARLGNFGIFRYRKDKFNRWIYKINDFQLEAHPPTLQAQEYIK